MANILGAASAVIGAVSAVSSVVNAATTLANTAKNVLTSTGFVPASAGGGGGGGGGGASAGESRIPNPLHDYALYNYLFSLQVLDDGAFNAAAYKKAGGAPPYLARSASMTPDERVPTAYGKFEFFIEDVKISHIVGLDKTTGNTNACGFTFKIIEPYSMGLFFQALQTDALVKGHANYLDAPLLLTLEFKGHKNPEEMMETIPFTTKHFPLKLRLIDMKVTSHGCEYDIAAYPTNENAFEKAQISLKTAVALKGKTVKEMLKTDPERSFEVYLNKRAKENEKNEIVDQADQYEIRFIDAPEIESADMGFDLYKKGDPPFAKDNLSYENGVYKRGNISIDPKEAEFRFAQGSDAINVINQTILMSEYGRNALKNISGDGFIKWWRIEIDMEYITSNANLAKTGVKPKKFIYRVVPYLADSSHFLPPNEKRKGTEADKAQVCKEYNYLYSGKNIDVLNFDINFKAGFYTAINSDGGKNSADKNQKMADSTAIQKQEFDKDRKQVQVQPGQAAIGSNELPSQMRPSAVNTSSSGRGGGGYDDASSLAAKQFHDAIAAGVDMVNLDMTILGDPYFLSDSGMGNYHASSAGKYINSDKAMSWDNGEIHVIVNFKTPVDIDLTTGLYDFGKVHTAGQFSGLYRVIKGESLFQRGKFTQTLKLIRIRNQDSPSGAGAVATQPEETQEAPDP